MADQRKNLWLLGGANKYNQGLSMPRHGTFQGAGRIESEHSFGWDSKAKALVHKTDHGLGCVTTEHLPLPVEVAEGFLLRCQDPTFRRVFFDSRATEEVEEILETNGVRLRVWRGKVASLGHSNIIMPGFSVELVDSEPKQRMFLFYGLWHVFSHYIARCSSHEVRTQLRTA